MRESGQLRTGDIWQKGLDTLRATRRQTLIIACAGLLLPQLLLNFALDARSAGIVEQVRKATMNSLGQNVPFTSLLAPAIGFASVLALGAILLLGCGLAAYFALVHIAVLHHRGETAVKTAEAFKYGASLAARRGPALAAATFVIAFVGQALIAPALVASILALLLPVIIVAEGKGSWSSLRAALSMRYVKGTAFSGWAVLFALLSLGATLYMGVVLIAMLSDFLLRADHVLDLPRTFWSWTFPGVGFGPMYAIASVIETSLLVALLALFPALTVALYFMVVGKRPLGQA